MQSVASRTAVPGSRVLPCSCPIDSEIISMFILLLPLIKNSEKAPKFHWESLAIQGTFLFMGPVNHFLISEPLPEPPPISNEDKISQCENCLEYDFVTNFYKDGRFCSQTCMGAFDSK